jgi:tetratricopeptide (TPR) repeat protein
MSGRVAAAAVVAAALVFAEPAVVPAQPAPQGAARSVSVVPTGLLPAEIETRVSRGYLDAMELVYAGRIPEAEKQAEELVTLAPDDPRPYLLKARVMREYVSEQDNTRENVKPQVAPILGVLDVALDRSEAILRKDPDAVAGHLYRGWTRMFRGQLHELAFEHWSAGRSAKAGKSDLDRVLSQDPANPDARMIMGTYLYFADLLPGVLKIASFLLRIPGGDRAEGLEMLRSVESIPSYSQHDARGMRGAILFGFEGDLAAARELFDGFDEDFPDNPRLVEPLAVLDLWFVERLGAGLPRIERVVQANEIRGDPHALELTARLRLYQSWMEMLSGRFEAGCANLEKLHRNNPGRPDWFRPIVDLYLADAYLLCGQTDRAVAVRSGARDDEEIRELLRFVDAPGAAASAAEVETLRRLQPVARAAYEGRLDEAESLLAGLGEGPLVSFYRGEVIHLRGRHAEALPHYQRLLAPGVPERCRLFVRIARLRTAEIQAMQGNWEAAARAFDDEVEHYAVKDMLRHVVRARQRFFDREAESVRS